jgi:heme-degrading monooxygenase HmoA
VSEAPTFFTSADWLIREGREDEFVQAWTEFVDWSATDTDAALGGMLLQDSSDPHRFISIGPWSTAEAAYDWFRKPELEERSARLREIAERFEPRFLQLRVRRGRME